MPFLPCFSSSTYDDADNQPLLHTFSDKYNEKDALASDEKSQSLAALRELMSNHGVDVLVIPTSDEHNSETPPTWARRRAFITGFTGSAGTAIISQTEACCFVDGRYHVQAAKQLSDEWKLFKVGLKDVPTYEQYLKTLPRETIIGFNPELFAVSALQAILAALRDIGISWKLLPINLVDQVWTDRPKPSSAPIHNHSAYAGQPTSSKLAALRKTLQEQDCKAMLVTDLAEVAWLLNLRGGDIPFTPIFVAYALVHLDIVELFVDAKKVTPQINHYLAEGQISVKAYEDVWESLKLVEQKCLISRQASYAVFKALSSPVIAASPVELAKSIKNPVELDGFRKAYLRDGLAWAQWAAWLTEQMRKKSKLSEWAAAEKLTSIRQESPYYRGLAYSNISATGANAALPHYEPTSSSSSIIDRSTPYLNDSGPQYLDATIDCTRTMHFGKPTKEQKRAYTRVLQGHIAVDSAVFPEGTPGYILDALARQFLHLDGLDFMHGTGHGIGSYLAVHEGPVGLSSINREPLRINQVLSNEPGYYKEGHFGIRIESIIRVKQVHPKHADPGTTWLGFERITKVPIDTTLIDKKLLSKKEVEWVRRHNLDCKEALIPHLENKAAIKWLKSQCKF